MSMILIISLSNIRHDARVKRKIDFIKNDYKLTVAAFDADLMPGIEFIKLQQPKLSAPKKIVTGALLLLRFFKPAYAWLYHYPQLKTIHKEFDLIIINDLETIAIANQIKGSAKLFFDAHEYFPRQFEDKLVWRILFQPLNKWLCKKYLSEVDAMTTIGEGIAIEYERQFHVRPTVINNAASYQDIEPSAVNQDIVN